MLMKLVFKICEIIILTTYKKYRNMTHKHVKNNQKKHSMHCRKDFKSIKCSQRFNCLYRTESLISEKILVTTQIYKLYFF